MKLVTITNSYEPETDQRGRFSDYFDYHRLHQNPANAQRDASSLINFGSNCRNSYFLARDPQNNICGVSAVIEHAGQHVELGGTLVTRNGLGLQKLFYWSSVFTEILQNGMPPGLFFLVSRKDNEVSARNIKESGFLEFEPDHKFLLDVASDVSAENVSKYLFFCIPRKIASSVLSDMAKQLLNVYDKPDIRDVRLRCNFALLRTPEYVDLLREVASGETRLEY